MSDADLMQLVQPQQPQTARPVGPPAQNFSAMSDADLMAHINGSSGPRPMSDFLTAGPGVGAEIAKDFNAGWENLKRPFTEDATTAGVLGSQINMGKALLAPFQMAGSIFSGPYRSLGTRGMTAAVHGAGSLIAPEIAARDNPQKIYEDIAPQVDMSLSALMPSKGGLSTFGPPRALPPAELAKVPVPTSKELLASGGQKIEAADQAATGGFSPQIMEALSQDMIQALNPKRERIAPQSFGLVKDLSKDATLTDIRTTRELLNEVKMGPDGKERRAASIAIEKIDDFLARNEPLAAEILKTGQADYAAGKRVQKLEEADAIAGLRTGRAGYGGNEVNARRQVISPIVEKYIKGNKQGFTPDEISSLTNFVEGSTGVNALRTLAQMAPSKGGLGFSSGILPVATLGTSLMVGSGSNKLAALLTRNQFQSLIDKMAKRSPAYEDAIAKATNKFLAAAAAVQQQPTPAKIGALVTSSRALSSGLRFDGIQISAGELLRRMQSPATSRAEDDK